jgi:cytoskeletal protein CcmA (bactofilin family)
LANIGKSITIKGDLTGNEDLVIDGNIEGRIDLPNNQLTIGPEGNIKADIHAKSAVVVGHVSGNVSATERIEVQASGIVDGDVRSPRLVVQEGAVLNGAVEMGEVKRPAPAEPVKTAGGGDSQPSPSDSWPSES